MKTATTLPDRNWEFLLTLLPADWRELARTTGAVKRLRGFNSVEQLLRGLLLHVGLGCSLRETTVVAKAAGWLDMSDVALLKKLRSAEPWLRALCVGLLRDSALALPSSGNLRIRLIDATHVREPGQTGSQWRLHYSLRVPDWSCDCFRLTASEGAGNGESLTQFSVRAKDCLIADRGYAYASGIGYVHRKGGYVIVRHNPNNLPLEDAQEKPVEVLAWLRQLEQPGAVGGWSAYVRLADGAPVPVRVCAVRKSPEAVLASQRRLRHRAQRNGHTLRADTLEGAQWVVVLTTLPADFTDPQVLEWYRVRWQVELAFKRLKSLADLGHVPKSDPCSSRAWLYGKLLVALLTEKMQRYAADLSPWGGEWCRQEPAGQPVAGSETAPAAP
jgi:hypothetical protein